MGEYVRVESVEALKKFRAVLCKFAETVQTGLGEAEAEIQRTSFWLKQEQQNYWKRLAEKRAELYARAKSALNRKKMQKTPLGGKYSCVEEEKALAAAQRQLEEARQKQENVRRWSRLLDEESYTYLGVAQGMSLAVEAEIPNALAQLDNMIAALEAYAVSGAPVEQRSSAAAPVTDDTGRSEELASMARDVPEPPPELVEAYQALRAQTPSQAQRDETPIGEPSLDWPAADEADQEVREVLAGLGLPAAPVPADDKIVVAHGAGQHRRVYLERVETAAAGDSGWYFGPADGSEVAGYDGLRVADVLTARPDLSPLLDLPAGCLVVLDGASLAAVLDPQNAQLWPVA